MAHIISCNNYVHASIPSIQVRYLKCVPAALRLPACQPEWEPPRRHLASMAALSRGDWPGKFEPIPWVYTEIIAI